MRTGAPIILFVVVAGFHYAISASLESDESNESPEGGEFSESSTTPQPDESQFAAAHVKDDIIRTTHVDGERAALTNDVYEDIDGDKEALTNRTVAGELYICKGNDEELEVTVSLEKEDNDDDDDDDDGETVAQTHAIGENTGSDESTDTDSEENTSHQKTDNNEQVEYSVKSAEDVAEEESNEYHFNV